MIFCLGSDEIEKHWSDFAHHLYRFERMGEISVSEIKEDLKLAKKQLWGYSEEGRVLGIGLTRIVSDTCEICGAVGTEERKGQLLELYSHIEQWARDIGCVRIKIKGRKGWLRVLKGYVQTGVILEKEL